MAREPYGLCEDQRWQERQLNMVCMRYQPMKEDLTCWQLNDVIHPEDSCHAASPNAIKKTQLTVQSGISHISSIADDFQ